MSGVIYVVIVVGLVAVVVGLVRLNRRPANTRPNHIHTRPPR